MQIQPFLPARFGLLCGFATLTACTPPEPSHLINEGSDLSREELKEQIRAQDFAELEATKDLDFRSQMRMISFKECAVSNPFQSNFPPGKPDDCTWYPVISFTFEVLDPGNNLNLKVGDVVTIGAFENFLYSPYTDLAINIGGSDLVTYRTLNPETSIATLADCEYPQFFHLFLGYSSSLGYDEVLQFAKDHPISQSRDSDTRPSYNEVCVAFMDEQGF